MIKRKLFSLAILATSIINTAHGVTLNSIDGNHVVATSAQAISTDSDGDVMPDSWELAFGLDPAVDDSATDFDGDGIVNLHEYRLATNPANPQSGSAPFSAYSIDTLNNQLVKIDLIAGQSTVVGSFEDLHFVGLAFGPDQVLYAVEKDTDSLYSINSQTAGLTLIGSLGVNIHGGGLTFNDEGTLYLGNSLSNKLYTVNTDTGAATVVSSSASGSGDAIAFNGDFIWSSSWQELFVASVTGDYLTIGELGINDSFARAGLTADANGNLWGVSAHGHFYWIDTISGVARLHHTVPSNLESLAIDRFSLDTDSDDVADYLDALPLDATESVDTDGDGIGNNADSDDDNDGLLDIDEINTHGTETLIADSDADGVRDGWEIRYGFDPNTVEPHKDVDSDNDGFSDYQEYLVDTDPTDADQIPPTLYQAVESFENGLSGEIKLTDIDRWSISSERSSQGDNSLMIESLGSKGFNKRLLLSGLFPAGVLKLDINTRGTGADWVLFSDSFGNDYKRISEQWESITIELTAGFHTVNLSTQTSWHGAVGRVYLDNIRFFANGSDSDNDGISDLWEYEHKLDYQNAADALADADSDGFTNLVEFIAGSDPDDASAGPNDAVTSHFAHETFEDNQLPARWFNSDAPRSGWATNDTTSQSGNYGLASYRVQEAPYANAVVQWHQYFNKGKLNFDVKLRYSNYRYRLTDGRKELYKRPRSLGDQWQRYSIPMSEGWQTLQWRAESMLELSEAVIDNVLFIADGHDGDADGMADQWEYDNGFDFTSADDATLDSDEDGLTNLGEFLAGTSVVNTDSDGDGVVDGLDELPLDSNESLDTDGDGIGNKADTDDDGDGINDELDSHPLNNKRWTLVDSDSDGITDDTETRLGLDINDAQDVWADADGDRLPLVLELLEATSPTVKDNNVYGNHRLLVQQAYVDIKGEFASEADITFWVARLTSGESLPADVYTSLLEETNMARYGFIGRVYQAIMRRDADIGGALAHLKGLKNGVSKQTVVDTFVQSAEFVNRYGDLSNSDYVNLVYQNVLGRAADAGGLANWLGLLDSDGISRAGMMLGFIDSDEYINSQDSTQRVGVLNLILTGQPLSTGNKASYRQLLTGEGSINSVVSAILASNAYRQSLMATISAANDDTDGDGIPDGVEFIGGTDISIKDNDITANNRLFVKQMLRDMTGEQWSYQVVTAQVTALTQAGSRAAWVKQLLDMEQVKNQRQAISRLYFAFFLRGADYGGLMTWIGHYEAGMSLTVMAGHFAASTEFVDRYGSLSTDEFVNLVYQNVLGRAADPGGFAVWKDHLDSGRLTRGDMMVGFSESVENSGNTVDRGRVVLLFNLLYGRAANDSEFTTWRDRLGNGTDVGDLIDDITNSSEYLARFY